MKFKKAAALFILVVIVAVSLCSCSSDKYALTIDGNNIDKEIYGYYLSVAENDAMFRDEEDKEAVAARLCAEYVAGRKLISENEVTLSAEEKVKTAAQIKGTWQSFATFYKKYSVSKQTLSEIIEYNKLFDALIIKLYDDTGSKPIGASNIESYFNSNYVAVKIISADFLDEKGEALDKKRVDEITKKFTDARNLVRTGSDIQTASESLLDIADYDDGVKIIRSDDTAYPDGMFSKILSLAAGSVQVIRYDRGIYLIQKVDMTKDKASYFNLYKNECIASMKKEEIKNEVSAIAQSYELIYNNKVMSKIKTH